MVVIIYGSLIYNYLCPAVPITTKVVSSNPSHGEVYSIQHYVIKFVSDLQQVSGFLLVLRFPPTIKLIIEYRISYVQMYYTCLALV